MNIPNAYRTSEVEIGGQPHQEGHEMTKPPASATPTIERNPKRRNRVLLGGVVASVDGSRSFNCMIRDITHSGARLFPRGRQVPSSLYLIHIRDRVAYEATVTWNNGKEVGVSFKNQFRLADIADPTKQFLTRLWYDQLGGA